MKYAVYKTNGTAEVIDTGDKPIQYEVLSKSVGGMIEAYTTVVGQHIYINEEGRLIGLPANPFYSEDIRGDAVEFYKVDGEGESIGFGDDFKLRGVPKIGWEIGGKYTIFFVGESLAMTGKAEITVAEVGADGKAIFKNRGKRKMFRLRLQDSELMIFKGWDLPIKTDGEMPSKDGGFSCRTMRGNAMYNLGGLSQNEMRGFINLHQMNPFFVLYDHVMHISDDGKEELLFPTASPTSQRIADMQALQLKDGVARIVIN